MNKIRSSLSHRYLLIIVGCCLLVAVTAFGGCTPSNGTSNIEVSPTGLNLAGTGLTYVANPLPAWTSGQSGSVQLKASGGQPPYTWRVKEGSELPQGFALSPDGVLSGTAPLLPPDTPELTTPPFTVVVADVKGQEKEAELRVTIMSPPIIFTVRDKLRDGTVGVPYSYSFTSDTNPSGGVPPYTFDLGSGLGVPPMGLILKPNGILSGTPTVAGPSTFEVRAIDVGGNNASGTTHLTINPGPTSTTANISSTPTISSTPDNAAPNSLTYKGTFTITAAIGDWLNYYLGLGKASCTATVPFEITLKQENEFWAKAVINVSWTGDWVTKGYSSNQQQTGSLTGTGDVEVIGEFDPNKPDQVTIQLFGLSFADHTVKLQGEPQGGEIAFEELISTPDMLYAAATDAEDKGFGQTLKATGDSQTLSVSSDKFGLEARNYISPKGSYTISVTVSPVSAPK